MFKFHSESSFVIAVAVIVSQQNRDIYHCKKPKVGLKKSSNKTIVCFSVPWNEPLLHWLPPWYQWYACLWLGKWSLLQLKGTPSFDTYQMSVINNRWKCKWSVLFKTNTLLLLIFLTNCHYNYLSPRIISLFDFLEMS